MNTPLTRLSPAEVTERAVCMCSRGQACSSYAPGHALHLIQARIASATATRWADAIVERVDDEARTIALRTLDGEARTVWQAGGALLEAVEGAPVALHLDYDVLAIGRAQYSVAPLAGAR